MLPAARVGPPLTHPSAPLCTAPTPCAPMWGTCSGTFGGQGGDGGAVMRPPPAAGGRGGQRGAGRCRGGGRFLLHPPCPRRNARRRRRCGAVKPAPAPAPHRRPDEARLPASCPLVRCWRPHAFSAAPGSLLGQSACGEGCTCGCDLACRRGQDSKQQLWQRHPAAWQHDRTASARPGRLGRPGQRHGDRCTLHPRTPPQAFLRTFETSAGSRGQRPGAQEAVPRWGAGPASAAPTQRMRTPQVRRVVAVQAAPTCRACSWIPSRRCCRWGAPRPACSRRPPTCRGSHRCSCGAASRRAAP